MFYLFFCLFVFCFTYFETIVKPYENENVGLDKLKILSYGISSLLLITLLLHFWTGKAHIYVLFFSSFFTFAKAKLGATVERGNREDISMENVSSL